jgi:hypothetical protein
MDRLVEDNLYEEVNKLISESKTPKHYDNTLCTLYKIAEARNWSPYLFDIVKRLERAEKKGEFNQDLEKSKTVIDLWLSERNKELNLK